MKTLFAMTIVVLGASSHGATPLELSDSELCMRLTGTEVGSVLGSPRIGTAAPLGGCVYEAPSVPAVRLFNSGHATRSDHAEFMQALKASCSDADAGIVLCSVGADIDNGEISAAWFEHGGAVLEIEAGGGMTKAEALALVAAARRADAEGAR